MSYPPHRPGLGACVRSNLNSGEAALKNPALIVVVLLALFSGSSAFGQTKEGPKTLTPVEAKTFDLQRNDGFLTFFVDDEHGKVLLQIEDWDQDFLYASGLGSGLGSNPVGLDRGQWGKTRVVRFKRVGRRAYLIEQNLRYRATTDNVAEQRAVDDSFSDSVIWAADIVAQTGETCLVDLGSLLVRDAHRVVARLKSSNQGDYRLDRDRSFVQLERCRAFPRNTELAAMLTFATEKPGALVSEAAADGSVFSLRLHHSFVKLPDDGYRPRAADPRVGAFTVAFADYSAPLDAPLAKRFITRHRLEKQNPAAAKSPAKRPIIYYLDPGTPQPVRDALLDGARWWNEAFEDAGFLDAFQVQVLPDDADPMDVRYNVIQWVHRSTRGWSYGQSIVDPRTGEIIKGHVLLGSLRVRQDRLIVDGLTSTAQPPAIQPTTGLCNCCNIAGGGVDQALATVAGNHNPLDVSLSRLRQLSAHEVGHTLGFAHNFAASTYGDRASVMDYPAPRVKLAADQELDLSDAYGVGVGAWDRFMVRYAYSEFEDESAGLAKLIEEARQQGLLYLSDADARPDGAAHPLANLWDNGSDPITELRHLMQVRSAALQKLGADDMLKGAPLADFEITLVPIYLYHRYQVAATAKLLGGFEYRYAVESTGTPAVTPMSVQRQQQAVDELLATLQPSQLVIRKELLAQLPPKPYSGLGDRERFSGRTAMIFDPLGAAGVAARMTLGQLLQPQRVARLAAYPQPDWNLRTVFDRIVDGVWQQPVGASSEARAVQRVVQQVLVEELIKLAGNQATSGTVRATANGALQRLADQLTGVSQADRKLGADHDMAIVEQIYRFRTRPHSPSTPPRSLPAPPGSPIGGELRVES